MSTRWTGWRRKLDLIYLIFFLTHIPIMLAIDLSRYYPPSLRPRFTITLTTYYTTHHRDRFFHPATTPPWFHFYLLLEATYHLPLSVWAVRALYRNSALVPLHLLVWSVETGVSTATCVVDMLGWEGYGWDERAGLAGLYGGYALLAVLMGVDMFFRLRTRLLGDETGKVKKAQ